MELTDSQQKLKQVQFIFWINLAMTAFSFTVFMKSFDSPSLWKLICSGLGFSIFLILTILLLVRMLRLQKEIRS